MKEGNIVKCPSCKASFDVTPQNYNREKGTVTCPQGHTFPLEIERGQSREGAKKSEAVVTPREVPTFTPAFLSEVKKAWHTKATQTIWEWIIEPQTEGVSVRLRGATKPHEFFPSDIIEKMYYDADERGYRVRARERPKHKTLRDFVQEYRSPLEKQASEEIHKIIEKFAVGYKSDLGFLEFPRPQVPTSMFKQIVKETEQKIKELGYTDYDVFETTIVLNFPGEIKAYEEWRSRWRLELRKGR